MYKVIDGGCFKNMLIGAYQMFEKKYEILNELNVFPVPDGDTGNNMLNTLKSMYSMIADVDPMEPIGIIAERRQRERLWGQEGIPVSFFPRFYMESVAVLVGRKPLPLRKWGKHFSMEFCMLTVQSHNLLRELFYQ